MKISTEKPPEWIYKRAKKDFGVSFEDGVVFAVDDTIHIYDEKLLTPDLKAHERVHLGRQQNMHKDWKEWWHNYFRYPKFRLQEELLAYRVQYDYCNTHYSIKKREAILKHMAEALSGSMYGNLMTYEDAIDSIREPLS